MSDRRGRASIPQPLRELVDALTGPDEPGTTAKFLRGLTIGALVGAVLAGSSLWSRRRREPPAP